MRTGQARPKCIQAHQPAAEVQIDEKTLPLLRIFGCPVVVLFALVEGGLCPRVGRRVVFTFIITISVSFYRSCSAFSLFHVQSSLATLPTGS